MDRGVREGSGVRLEIRALARSTRFLLEVRI